MYLDPSGSYFFFCNKTISDLGSDSFGRIMFIKDEPLSSS